MPISSVLDEKTTELLPLPLQVAEPHVFDRSPVEQIGERTARIAAAYDRADQVSTVSMSAATRTKQVCCEIVGGVDFLTTDWKTDL